MELFGDRGAADHFAAFKDERLESALGQIKRGDQGIVAAANDHDILSHGHGQLIPRFQSLRMARLARRPGAPMMPPPGCVADPHR